MSEKKETNWLFWIGLIILIIGIIWSYIGERNMEMGW